MGLTGLLDAALPVTGMDHVPVLFRPGLGILLVVGVAAWGVHRQRTAGIFCVAPLLGAWVGGNAVVAGLGAGAAGALALAGALLALASDPSPGRGPRAWARGLVHAGAGAVLGGPRLVRQLLDHLLPREDPGRTWG